MQPARNCFAPIDRQGDIRKIDFIVLHLLKDLKFFSLIFCKLRHTLSFPVVPPFLPRSSESPHLLPYMCGQPAPRQCHRSNRALAVALRLTIRSSCIGTCGSLKTNFAVSKLILCFAILRLFLRSSHSKRIRRRNQSHVYIMVQILRSTRTPGKHHTIP